MTSSSVTGAIATVARQALPAWPCLARVLSEDAASGGRAMPREVVIQTPPEQADDAPEHADFLERIGSIVVVLGLQADVVGLAEEALDRRLLADERDDDVAVRGDVLGAHDDEVALEDAGVLHRVAA